jgi:hypothetical protein
MEVKSSTSQVDENGNSQTDTTDTEAHGDASGSFWGVSASAGFKHEKSHTGVVTSKSTNTRTTDFSAKYDISV